MMTLKTLKQFLQCNRGFTLLEMLIVLAIIGLVSSISLSLARPRTGVLETKAAAFQIAAYLRSARARAIGRNSETIFSIDVGSRTYWSDGIGKSGRLPENIHVKVISAKSEQREERISRIRFFPDGRSTGGEIRLRHGTQGFSISTDWLTGATKINVVGDEH